MSGDKQDSICPRTGEHCDMMDAFTFRLSRAVGKSVEVIADTIRAALFKEYGGKRKES